MDEEVDKELRRALWDEANRIRIDAVYSGRQHQLVANRWAKIDAALGIPSAVLGSLLASSAAVTALLGAHKEITAVLALIAAALMAARAFVRPDEKEAAHGAKGNRLINLASESLYFQDVSLRTERSTAELERLARQLADQRNALRLTPPLRLPRWAYERTKTGIAAGESDHENDHLWRSFEDPS